MLLKVFFDVFLTNEDVQNQTEYSDSQDGRVGRLENF